MEMILYFKILTDAGKEFKTSFIEKHPQIKHIISKNPRGAALSEAAILRIRTKLKYLDKNIRTLSEEELNQIVRNLNSENDSLKIVNKEIIPEVEVVENENLKFVLKQGDYVRVKVEKHIFEKKSSLENFSEKILIVLDSQIDTRNRIVRYIIGSIDGEFVSRNSGTKKN
jgi:DNA-directed RNA polymerase subunit H (RpoH/RPB5)